MAASAPREHSFASKPTTVADCQSDFQAARADAERRKTDSTNAIADIRSHSGAGPRQR
ncbi:hypothetical protein ABTX80_24830 [Streptomyces erythrochromogenes]|uniref:hypothetical protein n=1 Tax=Streptomyces erythrochromogenes TaxID=285574 RepID=UPI00333010B4